MIKASNLPIPSGIGTDLYLFGAGKGNTLVQKGLDSLPELLNAEKCCERGKQYLDAGNDKEAITWLEKGLGLEPVHPDCLFWAAYAWLPGARRSPAREESTIDAECSREYSVRLIEILEKDGNRPDLLAMSYNNWGVAECRLNQYQKALSLFRKSAGMNPPSALSHTNLGTMYERFKRIPEAVQSYLNALQVDPFYLSAIYCLGCIHDDRKEPAHAGLRFRDYLRNAPADDPFEAKRIEYVRSRLAHWGEAARAKASLEKEYHAPGFDRLLAKMQKR